MLEVSCGRGGGANFVSRTFKPQRYVGVDLEPGEHSAGARACRSRGSHVRDRQRRAARSARCLVRRRHQHRSLALVRESRPVLRRSAARAQTRRLLLLHRRLLGRRRLHGGSHDAGFELLERLEITSNVLHALRKDNARRTALFDAMKNRDLREEYKHWGGVVGYRAYNRFEAGQTRYFSHRLRRPAETASHAVSTRASAESTSCPDGMAMPNVDVSTPRNSATLPSTRCSLAPRK